MIDYKLWKKNLYSAIEALSDVSLQKEVWTGKHKSIVSSFKEDISLLFDSFSFDDDFWEKENLSNFDFDNRTINELQILKRQLNGYIKKYQENNMNDQDVLRDPEWQLITTQAKNVLELFKK